MIVSGSRDRTVRVWDMTDGSSKTLAITNAGFTSVAISSKPGWLVAAGNVDSVRHFLNYLFGVLNVLFS